MGLITISGHDRGEFGLAPFEELDKEIERFGPVEVFIDARHAIAPTGPVSDGWQSWIQANQPNLWRIYLLAESRATCVVVALARELSRTGNLIQVLSEPDKFRKDIARSVPGFAVLPAAE